MRGGPAIIEIFRSLADFLFPPVCIICGGECPGDRKLCTPCEERLTARAFSYEPPSRTIESIDRTFVLLPYDDDCRALVHAFKYHGIPTAARIAGRMMALKATGVMGEFRDAALVPVPLHPDRLRERGYNQSAMLAEGFTSFSGNLICGDIVARTVRTPTQTALSAEERMRNVHGAFVYSGDVSLKGMPVIIVDDVMTTGSTISECARALVSGGSGPVAACVVATPDAGMD